MPINCSHPMETVVINPGLHLITNIYIISIHLLIKQDYSSAIFFI